MNNRKRNTRWLDLVILLNFSSAWWCALLSSGDDKRGVFPLLVSMTTAGIAIRYAEVLRGGRDD